MAVQSHEARQPGQLQGRRWGLHTAALRQYCTFVGSPGGRKNFHNPNDTNESPVG